MSIWLEAMVPRGEYGDFLERFATVHFNLGGPRGMLLAVAGTSDEAVDRLLALVVDTHMANMFPALRMIQNPLPKKAVFLAGNQDEFEKYFVFDVISDGPAP